MNPALAARCFLLISFSSYMTNYDSDAFTGATPLALLKSGQGVNITDMVIGNTSGSLGEVSAIFLLIGAIFLLLVGIIDFRIPGTYIASFIIFIMLFSERGNEPSYVIAQIVGGGFILGVFFMATDYTTRPITKKGQYIYGCILGILTGVFRIYGASAEGVSYAIIIGNLLVPLIEKFTVPKAFGRGGEHL